MVKLGFAKICHRQELQYKSLTLKNPLFYHSRKWKVYTKYDIWCLIIFSVVTTLWCSTLIFSSLIISDRDKCAATIPSATSFLLLPLLIFFYILTSDKFVHVTSTHYHTSWYLVFEFTFIVTDFHRVSDI